MKFEHLIQINDPLNPMIEAISLDQLWQGLVLRAKRQTLFVPHLDECRILTSGPDSLARSLRYGDVVIEDRVVFTPQRQVVYLVAQQGEIPASSLTMTIEHAPPDVLFVRFEYEDGRSEAEDAANEMYNEFRRSAYEESDIDTIRVIRQLVSEGQLGPPLAH